MYLLSVKALTVNAVLMKRLKTRLCTAVNLVAQKRMTEIRHMHSYLVRSSCFKSAFDIIEAVKALNDLIMSDRLTRGVVLTLNYRHFLSVNGVASYWRVYRALLFLKIANNYSVVYTVH